MEPEVARRYLDEIKQALAAALKRPPLSDEENGRSIVASIDAMVRPHGGSAKFVSVENGKLNYSLSLPLALADFAIAQNNK